MSNEKIKLILADIDGTLIEKGRIDSVPQVLTEGINSRRRNGVFFSFISGRNRDFQEKLRAKIFEGSTVDGEALIYEDTHVFMHPRFSYKGEGLDESVIDRIKEFYQQNPELFRGLVPLPETRFESRVSWVTEEFARGEPTNRELLASKYPVIKSRIESEEFLDAEVRKSADAIDVVKNGASKSLGLNNYFSLLESQAIYIGGQDILAIGDAENDREILIGVYDSGGRIGFVGYDTGLISLFSNLSNRDRVYISSRKGPLGSLEVLEHFIYDN